MTSQIEPQEHYHQNGYCYYPKFYSANALVELRVIIERFHDRWIHEHQTFYQEKAINSAYLTGPSILGDDDRLTLYRWITDDALIKAVRGIFPDRMAFMNTQLFFNPVNPQQKNDWHRDPQYHLSLQEQRESLHKHNVIHCRIPLYDEPGIELVPASHRNWDSEEELNVRLERDGAHNSDDLSTGLTLPLSAGDLLVFSANMIHRGLYGGNRLSLDILFCDHHPELLIHRESSCLPEPVILDQLNHRELFE